MKYPAGILKSYGRLFRYEIPKAYHTSVKQSSSSTTGNTRYDLIGASHPESNLRPIHFLVPENEAPVEKLFRLKRKEVQQWNQDFWTAHNTNFIKERKEFMAHNQSKDSDTVLTPEQMSVFYKAFLDKNWRSHLNYNVEWYKRNAQLILLHLRVKVYQFQQRLKETNKT